MKRGKVLYHCVNIFIKALESSQRSKLLNKINISIVFVLRFKNELGRYNYVTPTSYLELISSFKSLLGKKRGDIMKLKKRYEVGLEKLAFAASQVLQEFSVLY